EHRRTPVYILPGVVTILAGHAFVSALQRKAGALVVELPRPPFRVFVTGFAAAARGTTCGTACGEGRELAGVHVLMAARADQRGILEYQFARAEREYGLAMTFVA